VRGFFIEILLNWQPDDGGVSRKLISEGGGGNNKLFQRRHIFMFKRAVKNNLSGEARVFPFRRRAADGFH